MPTAERAKDAIATVSFLKAAKRGSLPCLRALMTSKILLVTTDGRGRTALHHAAAGGHMAAMLYLLEHGAPLEAQTALGYTPLFLAVVEGHLAVVEFLVVHGANKEATTKGGSTPLLAASSHGHVAVVGYLLEQGCDLHHTDKHGYSALHCASGEGHLHVAQLLMRHGASLDARTSGGLRPIEVAVRGFYSAIAAAIRDEPGRRAAEALEKEEAAMAKEKAAAAADGSEDGSEDGASECDDDEVTKALVEAAAEGLSPLVPALVAAGADVNGADGDADDWTPLMAACAHGHAHIVAYLLEEGSDVHAVDTDACTALHHALGGGHLSIGRLLVRYGAEQDVRDDFGLRPRDKAIENGHFAVAHAMRTAPNAAKKGERFV